MIILLNKFNLISMDENFDCKKWIFTQINILYNFYSAEKIKLTSIFNFLLIPFFHKYIHL